MSLDYGPCPHCGYDGLHGEDCDECDSIVIELAEEPVAKKLAIELVKKLKQDHPELFP